ncbi:MAG: DNA polymerase III subunit beta [Fidelibacterota bacterium]
MKFSIEKSTLQEALQNLARATPTRSTIPILNSVLVNAGDGKLTMRATDLEITLVLTVDATIGEGGAVAVPHRTLMEITAAMPETSIEIKADDQNRVKIRTNFGSYDVAGSGADEFPGVPEVDNQKEVVVNAETLRRLVNKTIFALSSDELKPALTGVLFDFGAEQVTTVATDGHRLSICSRSDYDSRGYTGDVIVPKKFLQLLSQHLGDREEVVLWVGDNHLTVSLNGMTIFSRIIDERYPDYRSVLPQGNDKIVKANREDLLATVRRVAIFSNRSTKQIALRLSSGGNSITTEDPESASSANETIALEYEGEDLVVGYNAGYLGDILSHLDTETVIMKLNTPISAGLILPDVQTENEEVTMLLMPMRMSGQ